MTGGQSVPRGRRKTRVGTVVSDRMAKTVVVAYERQITHELYRKQSVRTKKLVAHDETHGAKVGDVVRVEETRPLSKTKRWRVVAILTRAQ